MGYILYSYPDCASVVVRMVLEELGESYRDEIVDMEVGEQRSEEFLRLNPRGLVPVLANENSGATVSETGAILCYLAEQTGRLAPPIAEKRARAAYLHWLFFLSNTVHADAQIQYYTARYVGEDLAEDVRPVVYERMRGHFDILDKAIAKSGGPWLLGDQLSMCDFYIGGCVRWSLVAPRHAPLEKEAISSKPHLSALLEKLETVPSVQRAFDFEDTPRSAYFRSPVRSKHTMLENG